MIDDKTEVAERCYDQLKGCLWGLAIDTASKAMLLGALRYLHEYLRELEEEVTGSVSTAIPDTTTSVPEPKAGPAPANSETMIRENLERLTKLEHERNAKETKQP